MAYQNFAWVYDMLNEEADYDALCAYVLQVLRSHHIHEGVVADLGCGTGELTLRLAQAGCDMIGVDAAEDMLCMLQEKAAEAGHTDILLVHQKLQSLNLYSAVKAAVSSFDTLNHIGPEKQFMKAVQRAALFLEPNGVFIFDMNTPYKHQEVLADNTFVLQADDVKCTWSNQYDAAGKRTCIKVQIEDEQHEKFTERFYEYEYSQECITQACEAAGLRIESVLDGERFDAVRADTQRYLFVAVKE